MCLIGYSVICNQILYKVPLSFDRFKVADKIEEGEKKEKDLSKVEASYIAPEEVDA